MSIGTRPVLFALLLALATPAVSQAQGGWGLKGGVTFSTIPEVEEVLDDAPGDASSLTGLTAGLFGVVGNSIQIQPELMVTRKGTQIENGGTVDVRMDFIEIPVLLRLGASGREGAYVLLGPSFGFNVGATAEASSGDTTLETDIQDEVSGTEISGLVGVGAGFGGWLAELRYSFGFTDLAADGGANEDEKATSRVLALLVGIRF